MGLAQQIARLHAGRQLCRAEPAEELPEDHRTALRTITPKVREADSPACGVRAVLLFFSCWLCILCTAQCCVSLQEQWAEVLLCCASAVLLLIPWLSRIVSLCLCGTSAD